MEKGLLFTEGTGVLEREAKDLNDRYFKEHADKAEDHRIKFPSVLSFSS